MGLISKGDESAYKEEMVGLVAWDEMNNLTLNVKKTREMIIDFRRSKPDHYTPLTINGEVVERVAEFKFLGVIISDSLSWNSNTISVIGKAQQRLYYLRKLKQEGLPQSLLINFYRCAVESVLTYCLSAWYSSCTKADQEGLERVVKAAGRTIGATLPSIASVFSSRCLNRSKGIIKDQSHPAHHLFKLCPSGRRYQSLCANKTRFLMSFFPQAVRLLNNDLKELGR